MSFIASVSAGKGFAMIADSLEIPELPLPEFSFFSQYVHPSYCQESEEDILHPLNHWSSSPLQHAGTERSCREDHAEKLFQIDTFSAIAAARILSINEKGLSDLLTEFKEGWRDQDDSALGFAAKLNGFCDFINREIKSHLKNYGYLNGNLLFIAHYDVHTMSTNTFRIRIRDRHYESHRYMDNFLLFRHKSSKISMHGSTPVSKALRPGLESAYLRDVYRLVRNIVRKIHSPHNRIPGEFIDSLQHDRLYQFLFSKDCKKIDIADLSIQQAIDLASMLIRLEMDYFRFTKAEPEVGGVISLAIVDEEGFRFKKVERVPQ
jgi:hypothetical protein